MTLPHILVGWLVAFNAWLAEPFESARQRAERKRKQRLREEATRAIYGR